MNQNSLCPVWWYDPRNFNFGNPHSGTK